MPRFSANLGFLWADRPLLQRIEAAAAAGFKAVELHFPYETPAKEVRDACKRHGLTLVAINSPPGEAAAGEFGRAALPGRETDFRADFDTALGWAEGAGAGCVHVLAATIPPWRKVEATATFRDNLAWAADVALAKSVTLLLEPMNRRDRPDYFYSTVEHAAEMIARVGRPNLRIMFDVYHLAIGEGDVIRRLERYLPLIGHVQIAAAPSRAEPDEGEIAYGAVLRALDAMGYQGWVGAEYLPREGTDAGLGWIAALGFSL